MSARRTAKPSKERERPSIGRARLAALRRTSEAAIARTSPRELANLPDGFWDGAVLRESPPKQPISLRVDTDVLAWFKKQGPRYQSRMNAVLRAYMSQAPRRGRSKRSG